MVNYNYSGNVSDNQLRYAGRSSPPEFCGSEKNSSVYMKSSGVRIAKSKQPSETPSPYVDVWGVVCSPHVAVSAVFGVSKEDPLEEHKDVVDESLCRELESGVGMAFAPNSAGDAKHLAFEAVAGELKASASGSSSLKTVDWL